MKRIILFLLTLSLAAASYAADQGLKCPEINPKPRSIKILRMQPRKRGKNWLEGSVKSVNSRSCDLYGMKTEEAEYSGEKLLLKHSFSYKEKEEAKKL